MVSEGSYGDTYLLSVPSFRFSTSKQWRESENSVVEGTCDNPENEKQAEKKRGGGTKPILVSVKVSICHALHDGKILKGIPDLLWLKNVQYNQNFKKEP